LVNISPINVWEFAVDTPAAEVQRYVHVEFADVLHGVFNDDANVLHAHAGTG
jgi:hypothetical protein